VIFLDYPGLKGVKKNIKFDYRTSLSPIYCTASIYFQSLITMRKKIPKGQRMRLQALGTYMRELRASEGYTLEFVCKKTRIHKNSLIRIEGKNKEYNYCILHLFKLADFYRVPVNEILWLVK
jgi:DNA-binding XRE family transcriptional regulator